MVLRMLIYGHLLWAQACSAWVFPADILHWRIKEVKFPRVFFFNSLFFHCYTRVCVMVLNITFFGGSAVKVNFSLNLLRVHRLYIFPQVAF